MISRSSSFPSLWSPSSCFPPTRPLPLSVSFHLCFPHSLLPQGPSSLHLNPCSSLSLCLLIFVFRGEFQIHEERRSRPVVGIAAPVKLTALCRKTNSHLLYLVLVLALLIPSSTSFLGLQRTFNISPWHFFFCSTQHLLLTHLLEVSAKQNRCTYSSSCTRGAHLLPASSPYPPFASLHFAHLWGQLRAPLSSQCSHTHSAKPHSSLSAPASLFVTVPQCPPSTALQRSGFLWEWIIVIFLLSLSICSPLWWHTHYLFYDWELNLNPLSPSVTHHAMAFSLSTGVSFLQHIRAP